MIAAATRTGVEALGELVAATTVDSLPGDVVQRAKCNTLINLAHALAHGDGAAPIAALAAGTGPAEATVIATGERAAAEPAAFANAVLIHGTGQDDTHYPSQTHPGAAALPAVLALGEREDASGAALVAALVAGYEVTAVVGERLVADVLRRGFRPTILFGTLGAAAAAASILALDARGCANALALATSFAGGLSQTWLDGSGEWRLHAGIAARNGIAAARLAASGEKGARRALEGDAGFARAFAGSGRAAGHDDWALDGRWRTLDVIYKPYPVCNINQAPITLGVELACRHELTPARVEAVHCFLNPDDYTYPGTVQEAPFGSASAAAMSASYCVAVALVERDLTRASLARFGDEAVLEVGRRVTVAPDESLGPLEARLEVVTVDGARHLCEQRDGGDAYRWDWARVVREAESLGATRVTETVSRLETLASVRELTDVLRREEGR